VEKETIAKQQREAQKLMLTGLELAFIVFERPKNGLKTVVPPRSVGILLLTEMEWQSVLFKNSSAGIKIAGLNL
jgi:hypothetical protein